MIKIVERNPVTTWISDRSMIEDFLTYEYEWWVDGLYHKEKKTATYSLVNKNGTFLSGFQKRVFDYLSRRRVEFEFESPDYGIEAGEPKLKGIEFREDQQHALAEMVQVGRGVWKAPTGAGKTLLICGLVSAFHSTALIVVHTASLFNQTVQELERFFGKGKIGKLGAGLWEKKNISVGMIQTLNRHYKGKGNDGGWGMMIVDEVHHVNAIGGSYGKVLKKVLAPVRFGFTATLPKTEKGRMAMEGLVGSVIGDTTYQELKENEVLADPVVRICKVPETDRYKDLKGGYIKVYDRGIVNNRGRNQLIVEKACELIDAGLTVLIMVEKIEHGHALLDMAEFMMPDVFCFLHGATEDEVKEEEKELFERRDRKGVIVTRIWSEGVNIRSIGAVLNAVGGESEIAAIQRFGRGLRKAEGKDSVYLYDFVDLNHKWFIKHSIKRMLTYLEAGWKLEKG